ncbi:unnamed protein product [Urochloa humidicola]
MKAEVAAAALAEAAAARRREARLAAQEEEEADRRVAAAAAARQQVMRREARALAAATAREVRIAEARRVLADAVEALRAAEAGEDSESEPELEGHAEVAAAAHRRAAHEGERVPATVVSRAPIGEARLFVADDEEVLGRCAAHEDERVPAAVASGARIGEGWLPVADTVQAMRMALAEAGDDMELKPEVEDLKFEEDDDAKVEQRRAAQGAHAALAARDGFPVALEIFKDNDEAKAHIMEARADDGDPVLFQMHGGVEVHSSPVLTVIKLYNDKDVKIEGAGGVGSLSRQSVPIPAPGLPLGGVDLFGDQFMFKLPPRNLEVKLDLVREESGSHLFVEVEEDKAWRTTIQQEMDAVGVG